MTTGTPGEQGRYRPTRPPDWGPPPYPHPVRTDRQNATPRGSIPMRDLPSLRDLLSQVNGCGWLLLLFSGLFLALLPLLPLYPVVRSAYRKTHEIFDAGDHGFYDPGVAQVQKARAWLGVIVSLWFLAVYGRKTDLIASSVQSGVHLLIAPWLLIISAPVVIVFLIRRAPPAQRPWMRARLRAPVRSLSWYVGSLTALAVIVFGPKVMDLNLDAPLRALVVLALTVPSTWLTFFVLFSSGAAVRTVFNTAEVHPSLPALLTGMLVWEFAAASLVVSGMPPGPVVVQFCALLGGPLTVTVIAWWELRRLRAHHGVAI